MQYCVAVLPFFPCLLPSETGEPAFLSALFPKIPKHRNHSTYLLYLLFRCRLLSLALSEHQEHLPHQEQNQQLLLLHRLSPDFLPVHLLSPESSPDPAPTFSQEPPPFLSVAPNQAPGTPSCPKKRTNTKVTSGTSFLSSFRRRLTPVELSEHQEPGRRPLHNQRNTHQIFLLLGPPS